MPIIDSFTGSEKGPERSGKPYTVRQGIPASSRIHWRSHCGEPRNAPSRTPQPLVDISKTKPWDLRQLREDVKRRRIPGPTPVLQCLTPSGGCLDGYSYYTFGREA